MRSIKYFFVLILFAACNNKPARTNNEIIKIEFARMGAWLDRGAAISIDSSLTYNYYDNGKKDYCSGKITQDYWNAINQKLEKIKFKTIPTTDHKYTADVSEYEIIITWKNGKRRIERNTDHVKPDSILTTLDWLNNSYKHVTLKHSKTPIKFETTYQNRPPAPDFYHTQFPPPK